MGTRGELGAGSWLPGKAPARGWFVRGHAEAKSRSPAGHAAPTPTLHLLTEKANIVLKSRQDVQTRLDFRQEIIFSNFG